MKRSAVALVLVWTLPSALFLAITAIVYGAYRIAPPDAADDAERAAVDRDRCAPRSPASQPRRARCIAPAGTGRGDACGSTAARSRASTATARPRRRGRLPRPALRTPAAVERWMPAERATRARLQVDVIVGTAPLGDAHWLGAFALPGIGDMLAINPGIEGIGADVRWQARARCCRTSSSRRSCCRRSGRPRRCPTSRWASTSRGSRCSSAQRAGAATRRSRATALFRFRTDTFVEQPARAPRAPPVQLYRGIPPPPRAVRRRRCATAALAGGRYLVAHLAPNGRYIYEHDLTTGTQTDPTRSGAYSMPRHAGTTYFLAELYRITKEEWLREPIERAFAHLAELLASGRCARHAARRHGDRLRARQATRRSRSSARPRSPSSRSPSTSARPATRATCRSRRSSRRCSSTCSGPTARSATSTTRRRKQPDDKAELLYYSGEAALALARMYVDHRRRDVREGRRARRSTGSSTGTTSSWAASSTARSTGPASPPRRSGRPRKRDKYREFCDGYGAFLRAAAAAARRPPRRGRPRRRLQLHAVRPALQHARRVAHRGDDLGVSARRPSRSRRPRDPRPDPARAPVRARPADPARKRRSTSSGRASAACPAARSTATSGSTTSSTSARR